MEKKNGSYFRGLEWKRKMEPTLGLFRAGNGGMSPSILIVSIFVGPSVSNHSKLLLLFLGRCRA